jgi:hypothetical protein
LPVLGRVVDDFGGFLDGHFVADESNTRITGGVELEFGA